MPSDESESSSGEEEPLATYVPKSVKASSDLSAASEAKPAVAPIEWLDRLKERRKFRKVSFCVRAVRNALSVDGISHAQLSDLDAAVANIAALPGFLLPIVYRLERDLNAHLSTKVDEASPSDALLLRKWEKSKAGGGWAAARAAIQQRTFPVEEMQSAPVSKLLSAVETELLSDSTGIIDLSYCALTEIPPVLINLETVIRYYLSFDHQEDLAALILRRFWHVDLSYNQLHSIPNAFAKTFEHITYLVIRSNLLEAFPPALIGFKHLHNLEEDLADIAPRHIKLNLGNSDSLLATCAHLLCREMEQDSVLSSLLPVHLQDLGKTDYYSCDSCQVFVTPFHTPQLYDETTQIKILHVPRDTSVPPPVAMEVIRLSSGSQLPEELSWHQDHRYLSMSRRSPQRVKHKNFRPSTRLCLDCWAKHKAGEEGCRCRFCRQQSRLAFARERLRTWPAWILVTE